MLLGDSCRFGKANECGNILGAGAQTALLAATAHNRLQLYTSRNVKRADSLWPINFGGIQSQQINSKSRNIYVNQAKSLRGIAMEIDRCGIIIGETTLALFLN